MKRIATIFATAVMALCAMADEWTDPSTGITWTYAVEGSNATIGGSSKKQGDLEIPSAVNGYVVTSIGNYAFSRCSRMTSITMPSSVTSIGEGAFCECSGLTSVTIGDGVTNIGDYAFCQCSGLTSVTIPNSVTNIGDYAFGGCSGLTSVTIGDGVTNIGKGVFCECSGLTSVTIPEGVTSIGDGAFLACFGLTSVTIPNSVTSISGSAFSGCRGLTSVTIPNSVTNIGDYAFSGCSGLSTVTILSGIVDIGEGVFDDCYIRCATVPGWQCGIDFSNVTNLTISEGTTWIDDNAFEDCDKLERVSISEGVTGIGYRAFSGCSALTDLTIPGSMTSIGPSTFSCCNSLTNITIREGVTFIYDFAFDRCSSLLSVTIPDSVTEIGYGAFSGCAGLGDGVVIVDGCVLTVNGECSSIVDIPEGTRLIANAAFDECGSLTSVTIPGSVTSIGPSTFSCCNSLTNITIREGVTFIDDSAFDRCSSLLSVMIPSSVEYISGEAFSFCNALTSICVDEDSQNYKSVDGLLLAADEEVLVRGIPGVVIPSSVTRIGRGAYYGCYSMTSISIPENVTDIENEAFFCCTGLGDGVVIVDGCVLTVNGECPSVVEIPEGTRLIAGSAFEDGWGDRGLTSVSIPSSVTSIGNNAFCGCKELTNVALSVGLKSIGMGVFQHCCSLTQITIPEGVTSIEDATFYCCRGLTNITIPTTVGSIGDLAFAGCTGLGGGVVIVDGCVLTVNGECPSVVVLPDETRLIAGSAFSGCNGLTSVTIPEGVASIGNYAFSGCSGLDAVDFEGAPPEGLAGVSIKTDAFIRYNVAYGDEWLPVIKECGFTNASSYVPQKRDGGPYTEVIDGIEWTFMVTNQESVVISIPKDTSGKVAIPSALGGRAVTSVGESAFDGCKDITGVVIPSSVASIGTNAFGDCTMVRKVEFEGVPADGWLNAIPGAWTKIYYNEDYGSEWKEALGAEGIDDGISYVPGSGSEPKPIVSVAILTVTNVVVHYVLNSVQPDIVVPISSDTGFTTVITEVKSPGAVSVPSEWKDNYSTFMTKYGDDFGKALMMKSGKKDGAGNEMFVWQDYVAGTDPTNPDDKFAASITMVGDVPVISYSPELSAEQAALRTYKTFGKKQLKDEWTNLTDADGETLKDYNFFKVTVEMK